VCRLIRVSTCWYHLSKSERLEGHAKKRGFSISRLSSVVLSADLVKDSSTFTSS